MSIINLIQSIAVTAHSNEHQAHYWRVLFSLIWKQTSFETMHNTWKPNCIGKNIIIIKSQWRKEMQLPGTSEKKHCGPSAWEAWSVSSLDVTRGVGDCAVRARAGAASLQSVTYRGNTDSTSSSQLTCSDQGFMKNPYSTCGTFPWSMGWSLESGAHCWRVIPTVSTHSKYTHWNSAAHTAHCAAQNNS